MESSSQQDDDENNNDVTMTSPPDEDHESKLSPISEPVDGEGEEADPPKDPRLSSHQEETSSSSRGPAEGQQPTSQSSNDSSGN